MLSYSSLVNKGKLTLPSVDSWGTNNNIMKDPPKSIMTRRIDKVTDNNDIVKMIDSSDRSSEAVLRFSRGVNPSVSVSYSNHGGSMQNFGNQQSFLPYRINRDGDFHPPVQAPQDLLPLSRMPRNTITVTSTPSMPHYTKELSNSRNQTTQRTVKDKIISAAVGATKTYMLQKPFQEPFEVKYSIQTPLSVSSVPTKIAFSDRTVQNNITPTKNIQLDNINISAETNKSETKNQTIHIDLDRIKTNDVKIIEYKGTFKGNEKFETIHENFELERNIPVYDTFSNMNGLSSIKYLDTDLTLQRNIPEHDSFSNKSGLAKTKHLDTEITLQRNLPGHDSFSNISGNTKTSFIHNDITLSRVLPEHEAVTNISQNQQKTLLHDKMKDYERKMILTNMTTNNSKTGDINKTSRDYHLQDKIQPGEFENKGFVPTVERQHSINYFMNNDKKTALKNSMVNN